MSKKIKILFIRPSKSSFIQRDLELLEEHFNVKVIDPVIRRKNLSGTFKTLCIMLAGILWADVTFSWFASLHAYCAVRLSRLFRKKSIVVVGGYEVAKVPEIGYGALLYPRSAHRVKYVLGNADRVLTVDDSLKRDAITNLGVTGKNIQTVPTGYDYEKFKPEGGKENLVLTVAYVNNITINRKGLGTFVKAAEYLPDVKFVIVGPYFDDSIDTLKSIAGHTVEFTGFISNEELLRYYQKAKVYCQLSRYEGLPNALCEAMLCECVPVGTKNCGIPTAIGDTGFYAPYGDENATAEAIKEALKSDKGKEARARIKAMFPIERREKELLQAVDDLFH